MCDSHASLAVALRIWAILAFIRWVHAAHVVFQFSISMRRIDCRDNTISRNSRSLQNDVNAPLYRIEYKQMQNKQPSYRKMTEHICIAPV